MSRYTGAVKFSALLQSVTPHRNTLLLILLLLVAGSGLALLNPWIAGKLTEVLLADGSPPELPSLNIILVGWLALIAIKSLLSFATQYLAGATGETMLAGLRSRVYEHIQILPMRYFHEQRPGDLLALLSKDADIISWFVTNTLVQVLPLLLTFYGAIVLMALIDPLIATVALVLMPLYYLAMKVVGRNIRRLSSRWVQSYADMIALVEENLGMIPAIKSFIRELHESERFDQRNRELLELSKRSLFLDSLLAPIASFLAGAGLLLLLWVGHQHMEAGHFTAPDLVSILLYALLLNGPISSLANVYGQMQNTRGAANRLLEFFAVEPEPRSDNKPDIGAVIGHITFRRINFAYPGRASILKDLSVTIEAGETVAITGENGAGKSTLAHILMRFVDPQAGMVLLDGTDIREVSLASLRYQIGLVAQHVLLLNGTIAENIAYARVGASQADIERAARAAHAHEFISQLPEGYQTVIGDQGIKLSGGQRQRLSLARTLLKDPPILILDEATSMFDPAGESGFIAESADILAERTVILITHRPASLTLADRILRMEGGKLHEVAAQQ